MRTFTLFAIERALGRRIPASEYDARLPVAERSRQVSNLERQKPDQQQVSHRKD